MRSCALPRGLPPTQNWGTSDYGQSEGARVGTLRRTPPGHECVLVARTIRCRLGRTMTSRRRWAGTNGGRERNNNSGRPGPALPLVKTILTDGTSRDQGVCGDEFVGARWPWGWMTYQLPDSGDAQRPNASPSGREKSNRSPVTLMVYGCSIDMDSNSVFSACSLHCSVLRRLSSAKQMSRDSPASTILLFG